MLNEPCVPSVAQGFWSRPPPRFSLTTSTQNGPAWMLNEAAIGWPNWSTLRTVIVELPAGSAGTHWTEMPGAPPATGTPGLMLPAKPEAPAGVATLMLYVVASVTV